MPLHDTSIYAWKNTFLFEEDISAAQRRWNSLSEYERGNWLISVGYFDDNPARFSSWDDLSETKQKELAQWLTFYRRNA